MLPPFRVLEKVMVLLCLLFVAYWPKMGPHCFDGVLFANLEHLVSVCRLYRCASSQHLSFCLVSQPPTPPWSGALAPSAPLLLPPISPLQLPIPPVSSGSRSLGALLKVRLAIVLLALGFERSWPQHSSPRLFCLRLSLLSTRRRSGEL